MTTVRQLKPGTRYRLFGRVMEVVRHTPAGMNRRAAGDEDDAPLHRTREAVTICAETPIDEVLS